MGTADSGVHVANRDGGLKVSFEHLALTRAYDWQLEASMCHLRGVLYMRLNRSERAKQNFLEALALDVKCFEAYNMLVQCQMLPVDEGTLKNASFLRLTRGPEWELIQGLKYKEQTPEDADFIRLMYIVRLKKVNDCCSF